jgi:hypothetical protein
LDLEAKLDLISLDMAVKLNPRALDPVEKPDSIAFNLVAKKFKSCWV